jgi:hypothetical protein
MTMTTTELQGREQPGDRIDRRNHGELPVTVSALQLQAWCNER